MIKSQRGSSLIEVLVTLLIVSMGLLGMASLQLKSMTLNQAAYHRLQAVNLASEIADSIFINSSQAQSDQYTLAYADTAPNGSGTTLTSIAFSEIEQWINIVAIRLPRGRLAIGTATATGASNIHTYDISICWYDKSLPQNEVTTCGNRFSEFTFTASSR